MPNKRPPIKQFTAAQRKLLLTRARLIHRQNEFDIRSLDRRSDTSFMNGRILIITPAKIGSAPKRNKLRRRLTALFYEEQFYKKPYDILVYTRKGSPELSFEFLKKLLHTTLDTLPSSERTKS